VHLLACCLNIPSAFTFKLTNFNNEVFHQLCPDPVSCYFLGHFNVFPFIHSLWGEKWSVLRCSVLSGDFQNCNRNVKRRFTAISLFLNFHVEGTWDERNILTDNKKKKTVNNITKARYVLYHTQTRTHTHTHTHTHIHTSNRRYLQLGIKVRKGGTHTVLL